MNKNAKAGCWSCKFWDPDTEECRYDPPTVETCIFAEYIRIRSVWPVTEENSWCGKWKAAWGPSD